MTSTLTPAETTVDPTEAMLAEMLVENTGQHMLDSGMAYGRAWQQNQAAVAKAETTPLELFKAQPEAWYSYQWVSLSLFHYLRQRLTYEPRFDRAWRRWMKGGPKERWNDDYRYSNAPGTAEQFVQLLIDKGVASPEGFQTFNSYNDDNLLSQDIQWTEFELTDEWNGIAPGQYTLLSIHGGADIRGGYTDIRVFEIDGHEGFAWDMNDMEAWCEVEGCTDENGEHPAYMLHGGEWSDRNGEFVTGEDAPGESEEDGWHLTCPHCQSKLAIGAPCSY